MEIKRVSTVAFAVSEKKGKEVEEKLLSGSGKFLGIITRESPEIKKGYFPLLVLKLSRAEAVCRGITHQTTYEKRENTFFINLNNCLLYHIKGRKIESYDLLNKIVSASQPCIKVLGNLIRKGETFKEDMDDAILTELMGLGLIKVYKPAVKEIYTLVMDEIISEADENNKIRHTIVKDRVNINFHMPQFTDEGYDLYNHLKTTNAMAESYTKDPIKYSVEQLSAIFKDLFQSEVKVEGVAFMPYIGCAYQKKGRKVERIVDFCFPVCFNDEDDDMVGGIDIKPISLGTEVGALRSVPIERETINFSDVAGLEDVKKEIREEIIYPIIRPDLAKQYGRKGGGGILLYGPPGCGKTYIAKATIGECGASFFNINISDLGKKGFEEGARALHEIFEEASKNPPSVIFFDEIDALGGMRGSKDEHAGKMLINQLLTEMDGVESMKENILFMAATNAPWAIDPALRRAERFTKQLFIPPPDAKAREELFKLHTKKEPIEKGIEFEKLADITDGYSSADIKAICDTAAKIPWEEAIDSGQQRKITMQDFLKAVGKQKSSLIPWYKAAYKMVEESGEADLYKEYTRYILKYAGGVDLVKKPQVSFKDVGGLEDVKEEIRKSIIYPLVREDLAKEFGKTVGGGILLYGPPGCGKTYIAKATAGECNSSFFNARITDILSPEKGESEKKIKEIFGRASRNTPAILFFDEVEGIAGRRDLLAITDVRLVDEFLTELDGFKKTKGLIVMGATNSPWTIDPALRRSERFTKQVFIPPPNFESRIQVFKIHCAGKPIDPDTDYDKLAEITDGYSSADIKAICDAAAEIPWSEALKGATERKINMDDFIQVIKKTKSSLIPWITMAKKELEKSGEEAVYKDLYNFLSGFKMCNHDELKEIIKEEKRELAVKEQEELRTLVDARDDLKEKIKIVRQKYYRREIGQESFKDIVEDYEKQLIDLDVRINRLKAKVQE